MKARFLVPALLALMTVAGNAMAYRLVSVPCGDLLQTGYTRVEWSSAKVVNEGSADGWYSGYRIDTTILKNLEIGMNVSDAHAKPMATTVNVQYQFLQPEGMRPGMSIGSWDLGTLTLGAKTGRSTFVCAYEPVAVKGLVGPIKVNLGYGDQKLNGMFGGVIIPLDQRTQLVAEYCPVNARLPGSQWYNVALGTNITPNWRVKVADLGGYVGVGLVYINHLGLAK